MDQQELLKRKQDIAEKYIEQFKEELGWFKSLAIFPIENKLAKIMIDPGTSFDGKTFEDLEDLGFWKNILGFLTPNIAIKIFDFLKEKQSLLVKAATQEELQKLWNQVNGINDDNIGDTDNAVDNDNTGSTDNTVDNDNTGSTDNHEEFHSVRNAALWSAGLGAPAYAGLGSLDKIAQKQGLKYAKESLPGHLDVDATKNLMTRLSEEFSSSANNVKYTKHMQSIYKKTAEEFDFVAKNFDSEMSKAIAMMSQLNSKLPQTVLENIHIDKYISKALHSLDDNKLENLLKLKGDESQMKSYFKSTTNVDIPDNMIKYLVKAESVEDLKIMRYLFTFPKLPILARIEKGIKGASVLDILFLGFDFRIFYDTLDEAHQISKINQIRGSIKKHQAIMHLSSGISSLFIELGIIFYISAGGGTVGGPLGFAIGATVGGVIFAVDQLADELYFNKKNDYSKNRMDYLREERTDIKQALLQLLASDIKNLNSSMRKNLKEKGIVSSKDAWEALIYQDELMLGQYPQLTLFKESGKSESEYLTELQLNDPMSSDQYVLEKKTMESRINERMKYILKLDSSKALNNNEGLQFIEQAIADSSMPLSEGESVSEYINKKGEELRQENSLMFDKLEKFSNSDNIGFYEFMSGIEYFSLSCDLDAKEYYNDTDSKNIKINIDFLKKYFAYKKLGVPLEKQPILYINFDSVDYRYIEQVLKDFSTLGQQIGYTQEETKRYFASVESFQKKLESNINVSESTGQNILYTIAHDFHGYIGPNDMLSLMQFFQESKNGQRGLYYDDSWNKRSDFDWSFIFSVLFVGGGWYLLFAGNDPKINLDVFEDKNMTTDKAVDLLLGVSGDNMDSSIEAADKELFEEYKKRVRVIVERELGYIHKNKDISNKILKHVKEQTEGNDKYIELPIGLLSDAKRAKIGDLSKYLFSYKNGELVILTTQQYVGEYVSFEDSSIKVRYESISPLRKELNNQEKQVIDYVDVMLKKINDLRSLEGSDHEDNLKIPVEIERLMSEKTIEWQNVKNSLFYLNPVDARKFLQEKSKEYCSYFEGVYIGMLDGINSSLFNDNLGDVSYYQKALQWQNMLIVNVKNDNTISVDHLSISDKNKENIIGLLGYKYLGESKTVKELLISTDETEQKKGQWLAKRILIGFWESLNMSFDQEGKLLYSQAYIYNNLSIENLYQNVSLRIKNEKYVDIDSALDNMPVDYIQTQEQISRDVDVKETNIYNNIQLISSNILKTANNVDWSGRRGQINFVPDSEIIDGKLKGKIVSWGNEIPIEINTENNIYKIVGWEKSCGDISQFLILANFINRIKGYYFKKNKVNEFQYDGEILQADLDGNIFDTDLLSLTYIKKNLPLLIEKNIGLSFVKYLNTLIPKL